MKLHQDQLSIRTHGQGTYEITDTLARVVKDAEVESGLLTVSCLHTSCSLVIMENADPSARRDLEDYLDRLVPEDDPHFTHTLEGSDDMPAHIKMALTRTSETIAVQRDRLVLGTWQGVFLWEHRRAAHTRRLQVTVVGL